MAFITKRIHSMFVQTPLGEVVLSGKAGEDPELCFETRSIEDSDDALTNDGQMIFNEVVERSYIQGVFAYKDADIPYIQSAINAALQGVSGYENGVPANCVMTDQTIASNKGAFVGKIVYNGTGTQELKFASAQDWTIS